MNIKSLWKLGLGDVLVELGPRTTSKGQFGEDFHSILSDFAMGQCIKLKATAELHDLDELTTEKEMITAVHAALETAANAMNGFCV